MKWAGGKQRLLPQIDRLLPHIPSHVTYHEPFLGGGALFFHLSQTRRLRAAVLSDLNPKLIGCWRAVQGNPDQLAAALDSLATTHSTEAYYDRRRQYNQRTLDATQQAAHFLYLNRTCYNGLYRVNQRGEFNVACGRGPLQPPSAAALRACAAALRSATLRCQPFEAVLDKALPGDFVSLDPPYPHGFVEYTPAGFDRIDHRRLREVLRTLDSRGCMVILHSPDLPAIRAAYRRFNQERVHAPRAMGCQPATRQSVPELVIRNYATKQGA